MKKTVQGVSAPTARMTRTVAFMIATGISIPVFAILTLIDWLWL